MRNTCRPFILSALAVASGASATSASAQTATKPEEAPKWKQSAALGFSMTEGNSDTLLLTASYAGAKKWRQNEVSLGLNGGYGESDSVKNNEYIKAFGQYNWLMGHEQRLYGFGRLDGLYDGIADVDYRFGVAAGLGYYFLKEGVNDNKRFNLSAEVGPGFVTERVGGENANYATIYAAEKFTWKISEKSRLWQSLDYSPQISELENSVTNFELGVGSKLTDSLELRAVLTDTYRTQPAAGRENNDLKFVTAIGYTF